MNREILSDKTLIPDITFESQKEEDTIYEDIRLRVMEDSDGDDEDTLMRETDYIFYMAFGYDHNTKEYKP